MSGRANASTCRTDDLVPAAVADFGSNDLMQKLGGKKGMSAKVLDCLSHKVVWVNPVVGIQDRRNLGFHNGRKWNYFLLFASRISGG
jgi:hypothetical protein